MTESDHRPDRSCELRFGWKTCGCQDRAAGACWRCSRAEHALCTDDGRAGSPLACTCAREPGVHGPNGIGVI